MAFARSKLGWPRRRVSAGTPQDQGNALGWPAVSRETVTGQAPPAERPSALDGDDQSRGAQSTQPAEAPVVSRETVAGTPVSAEPPAQERTDTPPSGPVEIPASELPTDSPEVTGPLQLRQAADVAVGPDEEPATGDAGDADPLADESTAGSTPAGEVPADLAAVAASSTGSDVVITAPKTPTADGDVSRETAAVVESLPRPASTRILTVSNQKGGVGKTTTTVNLAVALAMRGARVLVIDLDPQGNASTGLDIDHPNGTPSTYNVIVDKASIADTAQPVTTEGIPHGALLCVPATSDLAGAEVELAAVVVGREFRLKQAVDAFVAAHTDDDRFDYIFIDCPPSLGLLTVNALAAAGEVLIPIQCEYYALEGLGQLLETIELIHGYLNPALHISTMLLTMFDARTKLAGQVVDEVREHFGETVMRTIIPRSVKVSEAPSYRQSVMTYDPMSRGATSYLAAAREFAERGTRDH